MRKLEIKVLFYIDSVHLVAYLDQIIAGTAHFERDVSGFIHLPIGNYSALHVEYAYHCTHLGSIDLQCVACSSDAERRHLGNRMKRLPWNFIRPNAAKPAMSASMANAESTVPAKARAAATFAAHQTRNVTKKSTAS